MDQPDSKNPKFESERELDDVDLFYDRMAAKGDWHEVANSYETQRRLDIIGQILQDFDLEGKTLLDGGSGGGHFSAMACRLRANVTSLDVGEALLEQVREKCDSKTIVGDLMSLLFDDGFFDFVLSTEVIEHTPDPAVALSELARVVKPGGTILVTTPGKLWQPVVRGASKFGLRPFQGRENFLWPRTARKILLNSGFSVEKCFGFNLLPLFKSSFGSFHRVFDRMGEFIPELFVNFALLGSKRND